MLAVLAASRKTEIVGKRVRSLAKKLKGAYRLHNGNDTR